MAEYRLVKKTVSTDWHAGDPKTVAIPDDARFVDVQYGTPAEGSTPTLEAEIRYFEPVEEDSNA